MNRESLYESDGDDYDDIGEDLEDLRRACILTDDNSASVGSDSGEIPSDSEKEDELEMLKNIKSQLASSTTDVDLDSEDDLEMLRSIKSQLALPMDEEDNEDGEFDETIRAISSRFSAYETTSIESLEHLETSSLTPSVSLSFPESAQAFVDAIRKNRSYQMFLRSKLSEIEATVKQNEKHKKNVMIVKGFQASCLRITRQALSQRKDPRFELISSRKYGTCEGSDKKTSPLTLGPDENPCVASYRMALERYPVSVCRKKWSAKENENLAKGLKQQLQETLILEATEQSSDLDGSTDDINTILESIRNLEITPEMIRQFLPKVNWDQLASAYMKNRSAAECEARWMSSEDPLINRGPWTEKEDTYIRSTTRNNHFTDWLDIAVSLGTNRTPFECLARYQRSLNPDILRREWTAEEDDELRDAIGLFGEKNWQPVANLLKGRTGTQCSNRWMKSIHPTIERKGVWSSEEDKRLKVAVTLFGGKKWYKIAEFVPGRTKSQCRERWKCCLDPNLKNGRWTEEEDVKLSEAVKEHGHGKWSNVASDLPCRTGNQCRRRWNRLNPHLAPLMQKAARLKREAVVGNFVDRESERPDLTVDDFLAIAEMSLEQEPVPKKKRKAREKKADAECESEAICADDTERKPKRRRKGLERCSGDVCRQENETEDNVKEKKQRLKRKTVVGTSNNSSVTTYGTQVKSGVSKLKPRRKVSAVVPVENQDAPN
ncbi:unnamed protein product [Microthlaspi erraticum]|uniref:Uncharacterized protein n=1 Tax=Microthlaspi erraticum TaxID=1685480 RepID=A0A6D2KR39_9BRAS|nr:unnamed protein product [Microthlaspi erraticum]